MPTVLVTGASTGIGEATVSLLSRRDYRVIAGIRDPADAESATWRNAAAVRPVVLDITEPESIAAAKESLNGDQLHGLVNNAGTGIPGPLELLPIDDFRSQLEVNLVGQLAVTQAFLPSLRDSHGRVVFVGSIGGTAPVAFAGAYITSKFALEGMADALRQELRDSDIAVSLIEPGVVDTSIWPKAAERLRSLIGSLDRRQAEQYGQPLAEFEQRLENAPEHGIDPGEVAETIAEALSADRPRTRYPVGFGARVLYRLRPMIPDRIYDALVARAL